MGKIYSHLTRESRDMIFLLHEEGRSLGCIAKILGVHKSTVSREMRRNKDPALGWLPDAAQSLSLGRRNRPGTKIMRSGALQQFLEENIAMGFSPEVIAGRLKLESSKHIISHESIYRWIYGQARDKKLHWHLVRRKRKRGWRPCRKDKKPMIPARICIHDRPQAFAREFGHWEGDTVIFAGGKGAVVTLYERQSKLTLAKKVGRKTTASVIEAIREMIGDLFESSRKSITFDNGGEFAGHQELHSLLAQKTFFCDPYASWQKGGVENANGILRRAIPKGAKAEEYTDKDIEGITDFINSTPRKSLGWLTPVEKFNSYVTGEDAMIKELFNDVALQL